MRAAISIVLASLLVITPFELVVAQAAQQGAVSVQQTAPPDSTTRLIRVPPLTDKTARLWMVSSNKAHLNTEFAGASLPQGGIGDKRELIIGLAVIVGLGAVVGGVAAAGDGDGWKSKSVAEGAAVGAAIAIPVTLVVVLVHLVCSGEACDDLFWGP